MDSVDRYANDIVLIFEEEEKAQVFLDELTKVIQSFGMHFAPKMCNVMLLDMQSPNTPLTIHGEDRLKLPCLSVYSSEWSRKLKDPKIDAYCLRNTHTKPKCGYASQNAKHELSYSTFLPPCPVVHPHKSARSMPIQFLRRNSTAHRYLSEDAQQLSVVNGHCASKPNWPEWNVNTNPQPTDEIQREISILKRHKAPGTDGLHPIPFKEGGEVLVNSVTTILQKSWDENRISVEWSSSTVNEVSKKGARTSCVDHRGISLEDGSDQRSWYWLLYFAAKSLFDRLWLVSTLHVVVRKEPFEEVGRLACAARGQASAAYAATQLLK
ncbi:hypothetical protein CLF_104723 [Clonorchis sinensis]|uniref:Reverse transcriptase domain-containing protein n=1 Tax=Clonorchis sinensis TaxID=79923 RepID=G7YC69_CLOSI|nr:hypothetical protein CLF_104723 [Clonorchis sinensis]